MNSDVFVHQLPDVAFEFYVDGQRLHATLSADSARSPDLCDARGLHIVLDGAVVAWNRGDEPLVYSQYLDQLEFGPHVVKYIVQFDSDDVQTGTRTFFYSGVTCKGRTAPPLPIFGYGCGSVRAGRTVAWALDESIGLPATITLRGAKDAQLFIQACDPRCYDPPRDTQNGWATLTLDQDNRVFVVGAYGQPAGDVAFEVRVEKCSSELPAELCLAWQPSKRAPARYAVCIGISKYTIVPPLNWADADAVSWLDYLTARDYAYRLFGDGVSSYSPYSPSAFGRRNEISKCIRALEEVVVEGDVVAITHSGHGSSDGSNHSWLVCLDDNNATNPAGGYDDVAFADDVSRLTRKGARAFVFVDACHSFGFAEQLQNRCPEGSWFLATTCSIKGVGYDDATVHHGSFTYAFLVKGLLGRFKRLNPTVGEVFQYARDIYRFRTDPNNMPHSAGNGDLRLM